jgi:hypothetical protein
VSFVIYAIADLTRHLVSYALTMPRWTMTGISTPSLADILVQIIQSERTLAISVQKRISRARAE